jgi:predicted AAA+ superfamily ATPase
MYRKIENNLKHWKEHETNKAFILKGARQTGKTYIINDFCTKNFHSFFEVNLLENNIARKTLLTCENIEDFLFSSLKN